MPRALTVPSTFSWTEVSGLELKGAFPSALSYLFLFPSSPGLPQASPPSRSAPSLHRDLFGCGEELPAGCGRTPSAAVLPLRRRESEATRAAAAAATSSALPPVSATRARMRGPAPGGGGRRADPGFGAQRRAGREIYGLCIHFLAPEARAPAGWCHTSRGRELGPQAPGRVWCPRVSPS